MCPLFPCNMKSVQAVVFLYIHVTVFLLVKNTLQCLECRLLHACLTGQLRLCTVTEGRHDNRMIYRLHTAAT